MAQGRCLQLAQASRSWSLLGEEGRHEARCRRRKGRRNMHRVTTRVTAGWAGPQLEDAAVVSGGYSSCGEQVASLMQEHGFHALRLH